MDQEILDYIQQNENLSDNTPIIDKKRHKQTSCLKAEVSVPGGRIDVLTETELIEINGSRFGILLRFV